LIVAVPFRSVVILSLTAAAMLLAAAVWIFVPVNG
jgi:hypothetical protein